MSSSPNSTFVPSFLRFTQEPASPFNITNTHMFSYLAYALRRAGHRVVHAVVLADRPPQLCIGAVLLQRVGAFVPEVVVDRRVPHRAVVHVDLPGQVLERPEGHDTETRVRSRSEHLIHPSVEDLVGVKHAAAVFKPVRDPESFLCSSKKRISTMFSHLFLYSLLFSWSTDLTVN